MYLINIVPIFVKNKKNNGCNKQFVSANWRKRFFRKE